MTEAIRVRADELEVGDQRVSGGSRLVAVRNGCDRGLTRAQWHPEGREYLDPARMVTVRRQEAPEPP